jgi:hypothetical protein
MLLNGYALFIFSARVDKTGKGLIRATDGVTDGNRTHNLWSHSPAL